MTDSFLLTTEIGDLHLSDDGSSIFTNEMEDQA